MKNKKNPCLVFALSFFFLGCEDKLNDAKIKAIESEAIAKAEQAKAEIVKAEAVKAEALALAEQAKADIVKAEAARADAIARTKEAEAQIAKAAVHDQEKLETEKNTKQKKINDAMNYLRGDSFEVNLKWKKKTGNDENEKIKYEFSYDEVEKTLIIKRIRWNFSQGNRVLSSYASHRQSYHKIDLSSAEGVVKISDYIAKYDNIKLPAKELKIKASYSSKSWSKNIEKKDGSFILSSEIDSSVNDSNELEKKEYEDFGRYEFTFLVTEDVAQRLKKALEDLFEAHGVSVPKY